MNIPWRDYTSGGRSGLACFLVLIWLACVLLQTRRKNQTKDGKARSRGWWWWWLKARKRSQSWATAIVISKNYPLCLSASQMQQPEFVLTAAFYTRYSFSCENTSRSSPKLRGLWVVPHASGVKLQASKYSKQYSHLIDIQPQWQFTWINKILYISPLYVWKPNS